MPVPTQIPDFEQPANLAGMLRRPDNPTGGRAVIAMTPGSRFLLKHHWKAWEVAEIGLDAPCWLPVLKRHTLRPGVNHTRTLAKGRPPEEAYQDGIPIEQRDGWTFIVENDLHVDHRPAGVPEGPYCREVDCRDPRTGQTGAAYLEAWQVPMKTMPGDEEGQRFQFDRATYNQWRLWLVESGQIAPPEPHVLSAITRRYEARIPVAQAKQFPTAEIGKKAVQAAEDLAAKHADAEVPEAPAKAAPTPPKERKPKAKAGAAKDPEKAS